MTPDDHHETMQRKHELERRLASYAQLKRHLLAALASLDQQLAQKRISDASYQEKLQKLLDGMGRVEKIAYYDGLIRSHAEELQRLERGGSAAAPVGTIGRVSAVGAAMVRIQPVQIRSKASPAAIIGILLLLAFVLLIIPNWGALKALVVYEHQVVDVQVNTFVPQGATLTYTAGGNSTSQSLDALAAATNLSKITSIYAHTLMEGYYIENLTIDVTDLGFKGQAELTITISYADAVVFTNTTSLLPFGLLESASGAPVEETPSLLHFNWTGEQTEEQAAPSNQSLNTTGVNATNMTLPLNATGGNVTVNATVANITPAFSAEPDRLAYNLTDVVTISITPPDANYSVVVSDPEGTSVTLTQLNFTPWLPGLYSINVLLYTETAENYENSSERFSFIINVTGDEKQKKPRFNLASVLFPHNAPGTLRKTTDGFRLKGMKAADDLVLMANTQESAKANKYKGRGEFLLKKGADYTAVLDLDFDADVDLSALTTETRRPIKTTVVNINATIPELVRHSILVPRGPGENMIYLCPFATSFEDAGNSCPNLTTFINGQRRGDMFASIVTFDGQEYFEVANVTGTSVSTNLSCGITVFDDIIMGNNLTQATGGVCIRLNNSGIDFNCNGNYLNQTSTTLTQGVGIFAQDRNSITIANCSLINFDAGIQFNGSNNHTMVMNSNFTVNNKGIEYAGNGTINVSINATIKLNTFNSSKMAAIILSSPRNFTILSNNFSRDTNGVACHTNRGQCYNITVESNVFYNVTAAVNFTLSMVSDTLLFVDNQVRNSTIGVVLGAIDSATIIRGNIFETTANTAAVGIDLTNATNATIQNNNFTMRSTAGFSKAVRVRASNGTIGSVFMNLTFINNTFNTSGIDLMFGMDNGGSRLSNITGTITFRNNTIYSTPEIQFLNVSINVTFYNTTFIEPGILAVVYPFFNVSLGILNSNNLNISSIGPAASRAFFFNGSDPDYAIIAVNATNVSSLNRPANVTVYSVNCTAGFVMYYNSSLIPFMNILNQSAPVADQATASGSACNTPANCSNVQCTGGNGGTLTFGVTNFSSYGVQDFNGYSCGANITNSVTLTKDLNMSNAGYCLRIWDNQITLNCNGHTINRTSDANSRNGTGIYILNQSNIIIANCSIQGFFRGIALNGSVNNTIIQQNNFSVNKRDIDFSPNKTDSITITRAWKLNSTIRWNKFNGTIGPAIILGVQQNTTIFQNNFTDSTKGIVAANASRVENITIERNFFFGSSAINVNFSADGSIVYNASISDNEFYNCTVNCLRLGGGIARVDSVIVEQNLIQSSGGGHGITFTDFLTNVIIRNNQFVHNDTSAAAALFFKANRTGSMNLTFINNTINSSDGDILVGNASSASTPFNITGSIQFWNTTFLGYPFIKFTNSSINMSFFNTTFRNNGVDVLYQFFNISLRAYALSSNGSLNITSANAPAASRNFYINGTVGEFGFVAVNATNVTDLNRSANLTFPGFNCANGFRLYYNDSFLPFIDTINISFVAADSSTPSGGACTAPAKCNNVQCTGGILSFGVTDFSTFGAQSVPSCGITITSSTQLTNSITQSRAGACITIGANDIVLDCAGQTLTGNGTGTTGVRAENRTGITIGNCTIRNFATGIEFTYGMGNSTIRDNTFLNNTNGTVLMGNSSSTLPVINISILSNRFAGSNISILVPNGGGTGRVAYINISGNNITNNTGGGIILRVANASVQNNQFRNGTVGAAMWFLSSPVYITDNMINGSATGIAFAELGATANLTILNTNITASGICIQSNSSRMQGIIDTVRCDNVSIGLSFAVTNSTFTGSLRNFTIQNIFINATAQDFIVTSANLTQIPGTIALINATFATIPVIFIENNTINITFNATNFTDDALSLVYPYFNISTNTSASKRFSAAFVLNLSAFYINASVGDFGVIAVNTTNLTDLNRSAGVYLSGADCTGFSITYNSTFFPFIDTLNQSFLTGSQLLSQGGFCTAPGNCSNVRCSNSMLTMNITQFSSYGIQNQPANFTCGATITQNTTLNDNLTQLGPGACFTFGADNIFLNCNSSMAVTLTGNGTGTTGIIASARSGIRISNCTLRNFATAIEFTNNVNHSLILENWFINNTNGTTFGVDPGASSIIARNITIATNRFNITGVAVLANFAPGIAGFTINDNNFTNTTTASIQIEENATIQRNLFRGTIASDAIQIYSNGLPARNVFMGQNVMSNVSTAVVQSLGATAFMDNLTIIDTNVSESTTCFNFSDLTSFNGTLLRNRCFAATGLRMTSSAVDSVYFLNITDLFLNTTIEEISIAPSIGFVSARVSGSSVFINTTFVTAPNIRVENVSINMTFNATNFTDNNASMVYPFFNISTVTPAFPSFMVNLSVFYVNGSAVDEYGLAAVNGTNLTFLNRSADFYLVGVDCTNFRITFNSSFIPFIDTLNQSFEVANQFTAQGGSCKAPGNCTNVRCANGMLTMNLTQLSSYGVQNQPGNFTCGTTITTNTTLVDSLIATNGSCITMGASNIFLQCGGNTLTGNGTGSYGVSASDVEGILIANCTFRNFATAVEFSSNVNHSRIIQNQFINNTNGTAFGTNLAAIATGRNVTLTLNQFNGSTTAISGTLMILEYNVSENNITNTSATAITLPSNVSITRNRIIGTSTVNAIYLVTANTAPTINTVISENFISNVSTGINASYGSAVDNLSIRNTNVTGGICIAFASDAINASVFDMRCEDPNAGSTGILLTSFLPGPNASVSMTNIFLNVSRDISFYARAPLSPANYRGNFTFVNLTMVTMPVIEMVNVTINATFNNTNFTDGNASLFYPYFNVSTDVFTQSFVLNRSTLYANGSAIDEHGVVAVNSSTLTGLNRSANAYLNGIDCASYRLTFNLTFFPFIDTLNQSFEVAGENTAAGGRCTAPGNCTNVRCSNSMLTFNITAFSSFGAQNQPSTVPISCGATILQNTTLTYNLNTTNGACITFGADNIFLACNSGATLTGNGTGTIGVTASNQKGIRIENCTFRDFATAIQFPTNVNHSIIRTNWFFNNTNGTTFGTDPVSTNSDFNDTVSFNRLNGSFVGLDSSSGSVIDLNITDNNFTGSVNSSVRIALNTTLERNSMVGNQSSNGIVLSTSSENIHINFNAVYNTSVGITSAGTSALVDNLTLTYFNVTNSTTCILFTAFTMNGSMTNIRCDGVSTGIDIFTFTSSPSIAINFSNLFLNATDREILIRRNTGGSSSVDGGLDFINTTFVTETFIEILNMTVTMNFNNTNFTDNSATLFYSYLNLSTNANTQPSLVINRSVFFVNGSLTDAYGLISLNSSNLTAFNRTAEAYLTGIDCTKYRLFVNASHTVPINSISQLRNNSFTVRRSFNADGGACSLVSLAGGDAGFPPCSNVRCSNSMLTFNITRFHSFGAMNNTPPPGAIVLVNPTNGNISVVERRPVFEWGNDTLPDLDRDNVSFQLNLTHNFCPGFLTNVSNATNLTPTFNLCTNGDNANPFNWTIRAVDGTDTSNETVTFNFTIDAFITINLTTNTTDFGSLNVSNEDNTSDNSPAPFVLQNDGNVLITVRLNASQSMWLSQPLNTRFFQFRIDNTTGEPNPGSFNVTGSVLNFTNVTNTNLTAIKQLNFSDASDTAEIDFLIRVPSDEPSGSKSSRITMIGEYDE